MQLFVTAVVSGITLGLLYSLFASGMGLVMRATGEFNLAHGDVLVLSTFVGLGGASVARGAPLVLLIALGIGALVGVVSYLLVYAPVRARLVGRLALLSFLPSLGVALIARNLAVVAEPTGTRAVDGLLPGPTFDVLDAIILPPATVWVVGCALAVPLVVSVALTRTRWGTRLRAVSDDPDLAAISGVPVRSTLAWTYAAAGALGALGGVLYAAFFGQISTSLGWQATLAAFVAVVVGGLRHVWGTFAGAVLLALAGSLAGAYVSTTFKDVATFVVLIVVLVIAPQGLRRARQVRAT